MLFPSKVERRFWAPPQLRFRKEEVDQGKEVVPCAPKWWRGSGRQLPSAGCSEENLATVQLPLIGVSRQGFPATETNPETNKMELLHGGFVNCEPACKI